jgi:hypothetical protein
MTGEIDRDKLRAAIRAMGSEYIFNLLDEAITLLSQVQLRKLIRPYLKAEDLRPDDKDEGGLLSEVQAFRQASLAGKYYEDFAVNSRNSTKMSNGTLAWIADCRRFLDQCVAQSKKGDPAEVRQAFDIIFGILVHIDECLDDVIFFADEGGSWQVNVIWDEVMPAWCKALSATATPDEYAQRIRSFLENHAGYESQRVKMYGVAQKMATLTQRKALSGFLNVSRVPNFYG